MYKAFVYTIHMLKVNVKTLLSQFYVWRQEISVFVTLVCGLTLYIVTVIYIYTLLSSASGDHNIFTMWHKYITTMEKICTVQKITTIQGNYTA